jgi:transposase InsO family protein
MCRYLHITRSAYYRWLKCPISRSQKENEEIGEKLQKIHQEHPDMGYRRLRDQLDKKEHIDVNDKRVLRICRNMGIQSTIKWKPKSSTRKDAKAEHIARNILHREFRAESANEKWLTDVSEFHYIVNNEVHKVYLSAILDLFDRRIVSWAIRDHNDNPLVMNTFDKAMENEPDAHPLFHSDRGFQYTSYEFFNRIKEHHMRQSMSRIAHCIDNGPMEGFWGIMKREMYYGKKFHSREELVEAMEKYLAYYNNERIQRKLNIMAPMEFHNMYLNTMKMPSAEIRPMA